MCNEEKAHEIAEADHSHEPIEIIDPLSVEGHAIWQPPRVGLISWSLVDQVHHNCADEVPERNGGEWQAQAEAAHCAWSLVVEELHHTDVRKHVGNPEGEVLRC